ncbi:MAG: ankyrin repeat domain-containing protein [Candidatus Amoebophilus sp.]
MNFNSFQELIARILLVSIFLQSCGSLSNPLIPIKEEKTAHIQTHTQEIIPQTNIEPLIGQLLTAQGGHAVTFYQEAGELKSESVPEEICEAGQEDIIIPSDSQLIGRDDMYYSKASVATTIHNVPVCNEDSKIEPAIQTTSKVVAPDRVKQKSITNYKLVMPHAEDSKFIHSVVKPRLRKVLRSHIKKEKATQTKFAELTGKKFIAQGNHTVIFYEQADKLWASVEENLPAGFSRTHEGLHVYLAADVAKVASLSEVEQKRWIEVQLPKPDQPGHVYIGKRGILGGMRGSDENDEAIPDDCFCPITREIMKDPVVAQDGHTYEREAIQIWFHLGHRTSPKTNAQVISPELTPNHSMRNLIEHLKEVYPVLARHQLDIRSIEAAIKLREAEMQEKIDQKGQAMIGMGHALGCTKDEKGNEGIKDFSMGVAKDVVKDYAKLGLTAIISSIVVGGGALMYEIGFSNSLLAAGLTATTATALYFRNLQNKKRKVDDALKPSELFPGENLDKLNNDLTDSPVSRPRKKQKIDTVQGGTILQESELDSIDVNEPDEDNNTPLHIAASGGRLDEVKALIDKGADVNIVGKYGNTPLHLATLENQVEVAKLLIESGADINAKNRGQGRYSICCTPLLLAARKGRLEIAKLLLEKGADVNGKGKAGRLGKYGGPLHEATKNGHLEVVKLLLEKGANVNATIDQGIRFSKSNYTTPLHLAIENGHLEIVKVLIEKGANVHEKGLNGYPLYLAVEQEDIEMVKLLLEKGVDVNCKNTYSCTASHIASAHTPLHRATSNGSISLIRLLIDKGAHVNSTDSYRDTPLHLAVKGGHLEVAKYLIGEGADIDSENVYGNTSIFHAIRERHTEIFKLLLKKGADVNVNVREDEDSVMEKGRYSLLHWAIKRGDVEIARVLLAKRANVNIQDQDGETPLHWAVDNLQLDFVKLLMENGADPNAKNNKGITPIRIASRKRNYKIVLIELLSRK